MGENETPKEDATEVNDPDPVPNGPTHEPIVTEEPVPAPGTVSPASDPAQETANQGDATVSSPEPEVPQNEEDLGSIADGDEVPPSEEEVTQSPEPINPDEANESEA